MYHHLRGKLFQLEPGHLIVEAHGIGFLVEIAFPVYKALESRVGEEILIYLLPYYREDSQRLFGFLKEESRDFFKLLLGVRGLGPANALSLLSSLSLAELNQAIESGSTEVLQRVRGVGRRTAERLIVELREKLPPLKAAPQNEYQEEQETAHLALQGLGYSRQEAVKAVKKAGKEAPEGDAATWIKLALRSR